MYAFSPVIRMIRSTATVRCATLPVLRFLRPPISKKLTCDTFIETYDAILAAESLHEKEKHYHRLTSVYGHIPTDEIMIHILEANATQNLTDRVEMILGQLVREKRGPVCDSSMDSITGCLSFLRDVLTDLVQSVRTEGDLSKANSTPTDSNAVAISTLAKRVVCLWKLAIQLAPSVKSTTQLTLEAARCMSVVGDRDGLSDVCLVYLPSLQGTSKKVYFDLPLLMDEILAATIFGFRRAHDLDALRSLKLRYHLFDGGLANSSVYPKSMVYYTEALVSLGGPADEVQKCLSLLCRHPKGSGAKPTVGETTDHYSDPYTLTVDDVLFQRAVLETQSVHDITNVFCTNAAGHIPTVAGISGAKVPLCPSSHVTDRRYAFLLRHGMKFVEDDTTIIQLITAVHQRVGELGPQVTQVLFESIQELTSGEEEDGHSRRRTSIQLATVQGAIRQLQSRHHATSCGVPTFCTDTPSCVYAVLSLLLQWSALDMMEVYVRVLTEGNRVGWIQPEQYKCIWKLALIEGNWSLARVLRVHKGSIASS